MVGIIDSEIDRDIVDIFGNIPVIAVGFGICKTVVKGTVGRECYGPAALEEAEQFHVVAFCDQVGIGYVLTFKAPFRDQRPCHA